MNQFVAAVKNGLLECQRRIDLERLSQGNVSPPGNGSENRILIAVSGGADSIALMRALEQLMRSTKAQSPASLPPDSLIVAHLNHGLRGEQSDADASWLEAECQRFALPFVTEKQELAHAQPETGEGLEERCRKARYDFLTRLARKHQCTQIAIAHTRDDQAETVLHHIVRGTGIAGLRGIPRIRAMQAGIFLIRPMLEISREEVIHYLKENSQDYREDESNVDTSFTRNRIRHQLIPLLKKEFNPNVAQAIYRLSQQADEVSTLISEQVKQVLNAATLDQNQELWRLDCNVFKNVPDHLIKQCFLSIWHEMGWSRKRMGFDHWQRLLELSRSGKKLSLPDQITAERRERLLILRKMISDPSDQIERI
ncbi:tRNA lysidine(34) synthetase TilS [uncultured Gimesia sp.]|uniref:tRNA lysidine(34) synthetase TilS n=1 Tax=uncultured Gimesia sp. TaxID=1678688 RepID=UPI002636A3BA|nr:tRNA lysidine(34) synthetase TilS [uncultured Gimesia sp.]